MLLSGLVLTIIMPSSLERMIWPPPPSPCSSSRPPPSSTRAAPDLYPAHKKRQHARNRGHAASMRGGYASLMAATSAWPLAA